MENGELKLYVPPSIANPWPVQFAPTPSSNGLGPLRYFDTRQLRLDTVEWHQEEFHDIDRRRDSNIGLASPDD
jgi:hypothetical protein